MDLEDRVDKLTKETLAFRKEMLIMKALIKHQNSLIKNLIEVNHQALRSINTKRFSLHKTGIIFPLNTQQDLDDFESFVDDSNREHVISEIMRIIGTSTLSKQLDKILSQRLIVEYNIDGHQHKKRLLNYPKLLDVLSKATVKEGRTDIGFRDELRKGLRLCKNRYFGVICMQRKKQLNNSSNSKESAENGDPLCEPETMEQKT